MFRSYMIDSKDVLKKLNENKDTVIDVVRDYELPSFEELALSIEFGIDPSLGNLSKESVVYNIKEDKYHLSAHAATTNYFYSIGNNWIFYKHNTFTIDGVKLMFISYIHAETSPISSEGNSSQTYLLGKISDYEELSFNVIQEESFIFDKSFNIYGLGSKDTIHIRKRHSLSIFLDSLEKSVNRRHGWHDTNDNVFNLTNNLEKLLSGVEAFPLAPNSNLVKEIMEMIGVGSYISNSGDLVGISDNLTNDNINKISEYIKANRPLLRVSSKRAELDSLVEDYPIDNSLLKIEFELDEIERVFNYYHLELLNDDEEDYLYRVLYYSRRGFSHFRNNNPDKHEFDLNKVIYMNKGGVHGLNHIGNGFVVNATISSFDSYDFDKGKIDFDVKEAPLIKYVNGIVDFDESPKEALVMLKNIIEMPITETLIKSDYIVYLRRFLKRPDSSYRSISQFLDGHLGKLNKRAKGLNRIIGFNSHQFSVITSSIINPTLGVPAAVKYIYGAEAGTPFTRSYKARTSPRDEKFIAMNDIDNSVFDDLYKGLESVLQTIYFNASEEVDFYFKTVVETLAYIRDMSSIKQVMNAFDYINEVISGYRGFDSTYNLGVSHYADYIRQLHRIHTVDENSGLHIYKGQFNMFPENLELMDDALSMISYAMSEEEVRVHQEKFDEFNSGKWKNMEFEYKDLVVVSPKKPVDIITEGQKLHHCVAGYLDSVVKEKTNILFIRKKDSIDIPYYTMEVVGNRIVQVRGLRNEDPTREIRELTSAYRKEILS